ncbi:unnamed protein product, partial [Staurois parvus]
MTVLGLSFHTMFQTAVWKDSPRTVINSPISDSSMTSLHTAVETAVWSDCPRTVRNSLFLTVLGHSLHTAV